MENGIVPAKPVIFALSRGTQLKKNRKRKRNAREG